MKIGKFFLNRIIAPLVVSLLAFTITGFLSKISTGNWWQIFASIPITVWIIIGLVITNWIMIIIHLRAICTLESENKNLKEKLQNKPDLSKEHNTYWMIKENGTKDGPFCMRCWDKNKDLIRLNNLGDVDQCPECKNFYRFGRGSDEKLPDGVGGDTW